MRILEPGQISDHVLFLGDVFFPVYFIVGDRLALVDAGVPQNGPRVVSELRKRFGPEGTIHWNLLTHSHYDHMGAVPFLKRVFPAMKTAASPLVKKILANPRALAFIRSLSGDSGDLTDPATKVSMSFEAFALDRELADGDVLDLGRGVTVGVTETPGHTRCSVAYFVEPDRVLFMGEASGVPTADGYIQSEFLSDYAAYVDSLGRMGALDPRFICLPHGGVLTGEDAEGYFERSADAARAFRERIEGLLERESGDEERVVAAIRKEEFEAAKVLQDEAAYMVNLRAMVSAVARLAAPDVD